MNMDLKSHRELYKFKKKINNGKKQISMKIYCLNKQVKMDN